MSRKWLQRLLVIGIAVSSLSMLGFAVLLYGTPDKFNSLFGQFEVASVRLFQEALGVKVLPPIDAASFMIWFRIFIVAAWVGYGIALLAGFHGALADGPRRRRLGPSASGIIVLILCVSTALAVFCPPVLSTDSYAYIACARLAAIYGKNPYVVKPDVLWDVGDGIAPFVRWNTTSPYGSVWILFSIGLIKLLSSAGLWLQFVAMKLVEAAALIVAALAGRRIAEHVSRGRGDLAMLAIGLNPLLLIEGPGSGHNDLLMLSLALVGVAFCLRSKNALGGLFLGLSTGIKFLTGALIPWAMIMSVRGKKGLQRPLIVLLFAAAPIVLCYVPVWGGLETITGALGRSAMVSAGSASPSSGQAADALMKQLPLFAAYVILSLWVFVSKDKAFWLTAWTIFSLLLSLRLLAISFPWYLTWPLVMSLTRWNRAHVFLSTGCCVIAMLLMLRYVVVV